MTKKIEIMFQKGGSFIADLFEKEAPKNCEALWKTLPIEGEAIHSALCGQMVWMVTKKYISLNEVHPENQLVLGNLPGTIGIEVYGPETNLDRTELVIVYGPRFYMRDPFHGEVPLNRIGIIKNDLDRLLQVGMDIREFGKQKVTVKKYLG